MIKVQKYWISEEQLQELADLDTEWQTDAMRRDELVEEIRSQELPEEIE